jgi:hypothetical protein
MEGYIHGPRTEPIGGSSAANVPAVGQPSPDVTEYHVLRLIISPFFSFVKERMNGRTKKSFFYICLTATHAIVTEFFNISFHHPFHHVSLGG